MKLPERELFGGKGGAPRGPAGSKKTTEEEEEESRWPTRVSQKGDTLPKENERELWEKGEKSTGIGKER